VIYTDQLNREIQILKPPRRIVSLVPSQTELLVTLGLAENIVGVTKFCVHPNTIREEKKVVGGTKKIDYNKIKELSPDIILCNKEENTKEIVEELEKKYVVHISDISSIAESLEMIRQYGAIFKKRAEANDLISIIERECRLFKQFIKNRPQKRVAYFIWRNPWMLAGVNTFINHLLELNNFVNIVDTHRYPKISDEQLDLLKEVDILLLSSEPFPFSEKHIQELAQIVPNVEIRLVDGEYFSWYGSRLKDAFNYFKTLH